MQLPSLRGLLLVLAAAPVGTLAAQTALSPPPLPRLEGTVVLDGRVDEAAWHAVASLPMTMYAPVHRGEPSQATDIRLAYDDQYLWASGHFAESDPGAIRANSLFRDRWSGDDVFVLFVDSFNDNRTARRFTITPAGTRIDELIGEDGQARNLDWNAHWEAATHRDETGWSFEMRIPFASLRFQERPGGVVMGISASRLLAGRNERLTFPDIDPSSRFDRPSETTDFLLTGIHPARPVYVTPYTLASTSRVAGATTADPASSSRTIEAGLDVKYSLSDRAFLDLSLNTDFAQVEADDQQVNLTRFPLFFPEKRQFFQERSDLFAVPFTNSGLVFHSRRIGLSADRQPVRILGGARYVGRLGGWDVGALSMQADGTLDAPGENFTVVRATRQVLNAHSRLGGILTSRLDVDGRLALTAGADASARLTGNGYLTTRIASSANDGDADGLSLLDRSIVEVAWERRVERGLTWWAKAVRAGRGYDPRLGFLPRRDVRHLSLYAVYNTEGQPGDRLRSYGPGVVVLTHHNNTSGDLESLYAGHWWNYEFWSGLNGFLQVTAKREVVATPFALGDGVEVVAGDHRYADAWLAVNGPFAWRFRPQLQLRYGTFYDGRQLELKSQATWNVSPHLELSGGYSLNAIRFDERGEALDVHAATLRARIAADTRWQGTLLAQYNTVSDHLGLNARLRYNVAEGTDLWVVYDEGINTDRDVPGAMDPTLRLPRSARRQLAVKFSYTFQP